MFDDPGTEAGTFDPYIYIDCSEVATGGINKSDLKLLHEGSAVKLACEALQNLGQGGYGSSAYTREGFPKVAKLRSLLELKRLEHLPEFETFFQLYLKPTEATWVWHQGWADELGHISAKLYQDYVVAYFESLLIARLPHN